MAYCRKCGAVIDEEAVVCPHCGVQQQYFATPPVNDSGSVGWAFLGFFIPLVGFILWLAWMDNKPKCSRMAGIGVLCFIVAIVVFMASLTIMLG